jgi:hypothetical protein
MLINDEMFLFLEDQTQNRACAYDENVEFTHEEESAKNERISDFIIYTLILCESDKLIILLYPFVSTGARAILSVDFHKTRKMEIDISTGLAYIRPGYMDLRDVFCPFLMRFLHWY